MNFHKLTHRNNPTIPPFCQSLNNAFRGGEEGEVEEDEEDEVEVGDGDSAGGVSAANSASGSSLVSNISGIPVGLPPEVAEVGVGRRGMALAFILALGG